MFIRTPLKTSPRPLPQSYSKPLPVAKATRPDVGTNCIGGFILELTGININLCPVGSLYICWGCIAYVGIHGMIGAAHACWLLVLIVAAEIVSGSARIVSALGLEREEVILDFCLLDVLKAFGLRSLLEWTIPALTRATCKTFWETAGLINFAITSLYSVPLMNVK